MKAPCRFLAWDSEFFDHRIAMVEGNHLRVQDWSPIADWCMAERIECLYFLAESNSAETIESAEELGFGLKDLRVTYEWKQTIGMLGIRPQIAPSVRVRPYGDVDLGDLVRIARAAHSNTRFFFDRRFDSQKAGLLYERWIRRACEGDAQCVLVGESDGNPAGYLSCHLAETGAGQIGLVAVDPELHGRGIGRAMIEAALRWFEAQGASSLSVITQGRNIAAHRFYQSAGFLMTGTQFWYHKWFQSALGSGEFAAFGSTKVNA